MRIPFTTPARLSDKSFVVRRSCFLASSALQDSRAMFASTVRQGSLGKKVLYSLTSIAKEMGFGHVEPEGMDTSSQVYFDTGTAGSWHYCLTESRCTLPCAMHMIGLDCCGLFRMVFRLWHTPLAHEKAERLIHS